MIPQNRVLIRKDRPNSNAGSIILPLQYVEVFTGIVTESKIADVPVGCHVTVKEETPSIELNGIEYFSAQACDLLLVTKM
jgi:hypothetical protein